LGSLFLKLSHSDSHARNLAYLIARALLGKVTEESQIDAAQRALNAMAITTLEEMDGLVKEADALQEVGHEWISGLQWILSLD